MWRARDHLSAAILACMRAWASHCSLAASPSWEPPPLATAFEAAFCFWRCLVFLVGELVAVAGEGAFRFAEQDDDEKEAKAEEGDVGKEGEGEDEDEEAHEDGVVPL